MRSLFVISLLCSSIAWAEKLAVPNATLTIEWRSEFSRNEQNLIRDWLRYTADSASLVSGSFPLAETTVFIHRAQRGKGPVPWANTIRHTNPEGVSFHVNPKLGLKAMRQDWTATHEFSHLLLPYVGRDDIWISEGFASYYQNLLMMRKGTLSQTAGWQKLVDGFRRGEADRNQNLNLKQTSQQMRRLGAYKRVYWSGALYFLEADLQLRAAGSSLDEVVSHFQTCCRKNRRWNGLRLAMALDTASEHIAGIQKDMFANQYRRYQQIIGLPDYQQSLSALGIDTSGKKISLSTTPHHQSLRTALAAPR